MKKIVDLEEQLISNLSSEIVEDALLDYLSRIISV